MIPILWLFSADFYYLVIVQALTGLVWAGFNLSAANFLFDAVSPPKRARCVAYQALVNATFVFAGSLLGGIVAGHLPATFRVAGFSWHPGCARWG